MRMNFPRIFFGGLVVFTIMVLMVVFMPDLLWSPKPTTMAHPYTKLEQQGRKVYWSNGCNYCHTQYVRRSDNAMGQVSKGGDFTYDTPPLLGSERTGPDLTHIGRKRSEQWEIEHLRNPRAFSPMSIMPRFSFLTEQELHALGAYLFNLGDRVAQVRMVPSPPAFAQKADPDESTMVPTGGEGPKGWSTWEQAGLQHGKELYIEKCQTCHGCAGNGLGSYAGMLIVTPANYKQEPFQTMPQDQWFWHVSEGIQGSVMPPWKKALSEEERWDVIRYIQTIFSRPAMRDPDEGDPPSEYASMTNPLPLNAETLDQGKAIFTRECLVCHGDAGRGHGPFRDGLQPEPPDFGDGSYGTIQKPVFKDADYFWRISEGVPWTAMPTWKLRYSTKDRWALVHYIRALFTRTEPVPEKPDPEFRKPEIYAKQRFPETVSGVRGRGVFTKQCAHCHGLALDGKGWDGKVLSPSPADFRPMREEKMKPEAQGEHLAKVTFGIRNTAMPRWGEYLTEAQRWDAVKYLMQATMAGLPKTKSVYDPGSVPAEYATLSRDMWSSSGKDGIDSHAGAKTYAKYCATCHAADGQGNGPGTVNSASRGPAAFPAQMTDGYVYWRTAQGVPGSVMPGFTALLDDEALWNVVAWVVDGKYAEQSQTEGEHS